MLPYWIFEWDNPLVHLAVSLISGTWRWSVCTWTSSIWSKSSLLCWTWWKCHSLGFGKRGENPVLLQHGNYCALCRYAKATFLNLLLLVHSYVGHLEACICVQGEILHPVKSREVPIQFSGAKIKSVKCKKLFLWLYFVVSSFYMLHPREVGVLVTLSEIMRKRHGDRDPPLVLCFLPGEPRWILVYFCITNS